MVSDSEVEGAVISRGPVFEQAGGRMRDLLKGALIPSVLHGDDSIQLTFPTSERDYRVGIFLYDMEEVRPYGTPTPIRVSDTQRQGPSCAFALRFLVFANHKAPFDSMTAQDEMILMEAVMRAIHNCAPFELEGETVTIRFDDITRQEKTTLWQSIGSPLQPAVYLVMEPLVVPSTRLERFVPVREIEVQSQKKEA